jgi:hypothetical protein
MRDHLFPLLILLMTASAALAEIPDCLSDEVRILAPDGSERARYMVSIADEPAERDRGLMFVEHMPAGEGMLFLFEEPSEVGFWMRNTLIPLDLLFIEGSGRVARVHADAVPHDETPIWSGSPVNRVLEINAGETGRNGVMPGDLVDGPHASNVCP